MHVAKAISSIFYTTYTDAWAKLVADTWIIPMNQVLRDLPMDIFWE